MHSLQHSHIQLSHQQPADLGSTAFKPLIKYGTFQPLTE